MARPALQLLRPGQRPHYAAIPSGAAEKRQPCAVAPGRWSGCQSGRQSGRQTAAERAVAEAGRV